jgi:hypothetical protein
MPRIKKNLVLSEPIRDARKTIKVKLDARTVITVGNKKALDFWKQRYPFAEVIDQLP